jgi:hypothetical protein
MDVNSNQNIKATLSGSIEAIAVDAFDPEKEAKQLLEIMGRSGVLPQDMINSLLGRPGEVLLVEPRIELELPLEVDENE